MLRVLTSAVILILTAATAGATDTDSLPARVRAAAEKACAVEYFEGRPYVDHRATFQACVTRLGRQTWLKIEQAAQAKASAPDKIANN